MAWISGAIALGGALLSSSQSSSAAGDSADAQVEAARLAIQEQQRSSQQGLSFLDPFAQVGQRGIEESGFLANPQAQFDFLQNNPLFQMSLDNANRVTQASAASRGRLNAGDTLQQLSNNTLLSASPLIDRQRQDIGNLLNLGTGIAQTQANTAIGAGSNISNLLTDIGAAQAGGLVGQANVRGQGISDIASLLPGLISSFQGG